MTTKFARPEPNWAFMRRGQEGYSHAEISYLQISLSSCRDVMAQHLSRVSPDHLRNRITARRWATVSPSEVSQTI